MSKIKEIKQGCYVLASECVQIFPCVKRDSKYDKHSRLTTEYNLTRITSDYFKKDTNGIPIDFVIGGYRIKLTIDSIDSADTNKLKECNYFWILPKVSSSDTAQDERDKILSPITAIEGDCLDYKGSDDISYFYGLGIGKDAPADTADTSYIVLNKTNIRYYKEHDVVDYSNIKVNTLKNTDYYLPDFIVLAGKPSPDGSALSGRTTIIPCAPPADVLVIGTPKEGEPALQGGCAFYGTARQARTAETAETAESAKTAEKADKLNVNSAIGDVETPVYITAEGVPAECTEILNPVTDEIPSTSTPTVIKYFKKGNDYYKVFERSFSASNNIMLAGTSDGGLTIGTVSSPKFTNISIDSNTSAADNIKLNGDGTIIVNGTGTITAKGQIQAQSFLATSDARKKENIEDYRCKKSILDLPVKKFDFIDGEKNQIGCIAQDLQEICPEIVKEDKDGYLSIQESKLVYLLLQEVKELKAEVAELKNQKR